MMMDMAVAARNPAFFVFIESSPNSLLNSIIDFSIIECEQIGKPF